MMSGTVLSAGTAALLAGYVLLAGSGPLGAADGDKEGPAVSAEDRKAGEAWRKAITPGERHRAPEPMAETFAGTVRMWMHPGAPPQESTGQAVDTLVPGGRYLRQTCKGTAVGMPVDGIGHTGYDNVQGKQVGGWMDSMGMGIMTAVGTGAPTAKELSFRNDPFDPTTGKPTVARSVIIIADADHHRCEMYGPGPDGREFKMTEIEYTRN